MTVFGTSPQTAPTQKRKPNGRLVGAFELENKGIKAWSFPFFRKIRERLLFLPVDSYFNELPLYRMVLFTDQFLLIKKLGHSIGGVFSQIVVIEWDIEAMINSAKTSGERE